MVSIVGCDADDNNIGNNDKNTTVFSRVPLCAKHLTRPRVNHDTLSSVQYSVFPFCLRCFRVYTAVFHLIVHRFCFTLIMECLASIVSFQCACVCLRAISAFKINVFYLLSVFIAFTYFFLRNGSRYWHVCFHFSVYVM